MATKRKATLKQLFKVWFKYEQKNNEVFKLKRNLDNFANQTVLGTELIAHDGIVYRITTSSTYSGRINYNVERIAKSEELQTIK